MKKWLIGLTMGLAILGLGTDIIAETEAKSVWELGLGWSSITYKEPGVMKEEGTMFGLSGSYAYHDNDFIGAVDYIKLEILRDIGDCPSTLDGLIYLVCRT